jgi:hypothetical protein
MIRPSHSVPIHAPRLGEVQRLHVQQRTHQILKETGVFSYILTMMCDYPNYERYELTRTIARRISKILTVVLQGREAKQRMAIGINCSI